MEYQSPEIIATYSEVDLAAEAAVCTQYNGDGVVTVTIAP